MSVYIDPTPTDKKNYEGRQIVAALCSICGKEVEGAWRDLKRIKTCRHTYKGTSYATQTIPDRRIGSIFRGMMGRCHNRQNADYPHYGGKGVGVCQEWIQSPVSFYAWYITHGGANASLTIDRIDHGGDYSPDNCRLVTRQENARWKSTTMPLTVYGMTKSGRQWAEYLGCGVNYINRYRREHGEKATIEFITRFLDDNSPYLTIA